MNSQARIDPALNSMLEKAADTMLNARSTIKRAAKKSVVVRISLK